MKKSTSTRTETPSVFQVAAHLDEFVATNPESAIPLNREMPFTDLMLHPEKVEAVLKSAESETSKTAVSARVENVSEQSLRDLKQTKLSAVAETVKPDDTETI